MKYKNKFCNKRIRRVCFNFFENKTASYELLTKMGQRRRCSARTLLQQLFITIMMVTLLMISIFAIYQVNNELIGVKDLEDLDNDGEFCDGD